MPRAFLSGISALPVRRHLERSVKESATQVALEAIQASGLSPREVEGLFVSPPGLSGPPGFMWSCTFAHHLGLRTKAQALVECGGMTATLAFRQAVEAVRSGRVRSALVVAVDSRVIDPLEDLEYFLKASVTGLIGLYGPFDGAYGIGAPIPYYAMSAQRYLHEHKVSREDLAEVAVALRENARENPRAEHKKPITAAEVIGSRMVSPPLTLLDCSSFSSGAAAVVVTGPDLARQGKKEPVRVLAMGEDHQPSHFAPRNEPITRFESVSRAAFEAYAEAGIGPDGIDVAEVYGVFSATELILYEDLGFFDKGLASRALREGKTRGQGRTVMNPSGGRLSLGHPAGATPLYSLVEIAEQLRGECGPRQVKDARRGLVHAEHGMMNGSFVAVLEAA